MYNSNWSRKSTITHNEVMNFTTDIGIKESRHGGNDGSGTGQPPAWPVPSHAFLLLRYFFDHKLIIICLFSWNAVLFFVGTSITCNFMAFVFALLYFYFYFHGIYRCEHLFWILHFRGFLFHFSQNLCWLTSSSSSQKREFCFDDHWRI